MAGYIKIHRKLLEWGWYSVPCVKDVFIHLLITANYAESEYRGVTIKRGQAVFGLDSLSQALGYSIKQIRTAIGKLKQTGEISVWTNRQFSVASIVNYDEYQDDDRANEGQTDGKRKANEGQTKGTQRAISKEEKEEKKVLKEKESIKKEKGSVGTFQNVFLTKEEYEKLKAQFPDYLERIDRLSEYIASSGKSYKSHYAVILTWARKDKQDKKPNKRGSVYSTEGASFDVSKYEGSSMFDD